MCIYIYIYIDIYIYIEIYIILQDGLGHEFDTAKAPTRAPDNQLRQIMTSVTNAY